jgi:dihydrofolate reductase
VLKLILACSADGFLASGPTDDMSWTGAEDKKIFRLLTTVGSRVCGVGRKTYDLMPDLKGRQLVCLSRLSGGSTLTLGQFAFRYPTGWLIGGPELAQEALDSNLVGQVVMCTAVNSLLGGGVPDRISPALHNGASWDMTSDIRFRSTQVRIWTDVKCAQS